MRIIRLGKNSGILTNFIMNMNYGTTMPYIKWEAFVARANFKLRVIERSDESDGSV